MWRSEPTLGGHLPSFPLSLFPLPSSLFPLLSHRMMIMWVVTTLPTFMHTLCKTVCFKTCLTERSDDGKCVFSFCSFPRRGRWIALLKWYVRDGTIWDSEGSVGEEGWSDGKGEAEWGRDGEREEKRRIEEGFWKHLEIPANYLELSSSFWKTRRRKRRISYSMRLLWYMLCHQQHILQNTVGQKTAWHFHTSHGNVSFHGMWRAAGDRVIIKTFNTLRSTSH